MYQKVIKRFLDIVFSILALLVLWPFLILLAVIGTIAMKGNPFFVQERPGQKGKDGVEKIFKLIKFRTMTCAKNEDGVELSDEERLVPYGKFLRSTSLDELPELINILKGDMSFVGPRPLLVRYLHLYSEEQRHRHDVRPGLTGWAQVNGRNATEWQQRFAYDLEYVQNVSIGFDMRIILRTVKVVFARKGISSETSVTMEEFKGN